VTALEFLFSLERLGMKFGLENMAAICAALNHPERAYRSIIVAGTNGKGSVTAMLSAALAAAGLRSARYTSPHLERLEERFVIGEEEVATADLEDAAGTVRTAVERLMGDGRLETMPTFFECATAIAFELFRRASVELAVIEVGLGGRLDATNVITPMAAAITSIDFDHEALLGQTLDAIAREKAGVIKPGIPVVAGPLPDEADRAIGEVCRERGATLIRARARVLVNERADSTVDLTTPDTTLERVRLALAGQHQVDNAAVAVCVLEAIRQQGVPLTAEDVRAGLERARWPGRLEAAHNAAGARALAAYLREIGWTSTVVVLSVMHDKNAAAIVGALAPLASTIVCTAAPTPRAMAAADLAAVARAVAQRGVDVRSIDDPAAALDAASRAGTRVVVCGSIFLIGALRGILR
jgi:dihydrofolate synthase/folylpolyglutamate synthase